MAESVQWTPEQISRMTFQQWIYMTSNPLPGARKIACGSWEELEALEKEWLQANTPSALLQKAELMLEREEGRNKAIQMVKDYHRNFWERIRGKSKGI